MAEGIGGIFWVVSFEGNEVVIASGRLISCNRERIHVISRAAECAATYSVSQVESAIEVCLFKL
jgi:hypothetical protein